MTANLATLCEKKMTSVLKSGAGRADEREEKFMKTDIEIMKNNGIEKAITEIKKSAKRTA